MSFLTPKIPEIPAMPKPPQIDGPEMQAARENQRRLAAGMRGNQANMLTGPMGLTGPAPGAQKMLLGA